MTTKRVVWRYCLLTGGVGAVDFLFGATCFVLLIQRGLDGAQVGVAASVAMVVSTIFELPSGAWGDRFGQRRMTVYGLLLWGIGLLTFGLAPGFAISTVGLCLWAAGTATFSGAPISLVVNLLREHGADDAIAEAVRGGEIARWTASAIGAASSLILLRVVSPAVVVIVGGAILIALSGWVRLTWAESVSLTTTTITRQITTGLRLSISRPLLGLLLLCSLVSLPFALIVVGWQPAAVDLASLPVNFVAVLFLAYSVAAAAGAWAAKYATHLIRPTPITVLLIIAAAGLAAAGALGGPAVYVGFTLAEIAAAFLITAVSILQQLNFADHQRNTLTSAFSTVAALVWAASTFLFGQLWDAYGIGHGIMWSAIGAVALACLLWPVIYRCPPAHFPVATHPSRTSVWRRHRIRSKDG